MKALAGRCAWRSSALRVRREGELDGHTLAAQIDQTTTLLQDIGMKPTTAIVGLDYRGVDNDLAAVEVMQSGKLTSIALKHGS